jgi:hypothetical protein
VTSPIDIELPTDINEQIEAALEALRARLKDPDPDPKSNPIVLALAVLSQLLNKVNPDGFQLQEAGIIMQAVALDVVIYHLSDMTPGEWFNESTTDIRRALIAIGLLVAYSKQLEAKADATIEAKAVEASQNTKADV